MWATRWSSAEHAQHSAPKLRAVGSVPISSCRMPHTRRPEPRALIPGQTTLMAASLNGHLHCVTTLIEHDADVGAATADGWTALMHAALSGHVPCVEALVMHNADLGAVNGKGCTALILAAQNGHVLCIEALVRLKADVNAADHDGWTALMLATQNHHVACIEALVAQRCLFILLPATGIPSSQPTHPLPPSKVLISFSASPWKCPHSGAKSAERDGQSGGSLFHPNACPPTDRRCDSTDCGSTVPSTKPGNTA